MKNRFLEHLNEKKEALEKNIHNLGRKSEDKKLSAIFHNKKRKTHFKILESINDKEKIKNSRLNYNKLISKNIEKNQKNLNNPEEYFKGFFNDIISHSKSSKTLKNFSIKKKKTLQHNIE